MAAERMILSQESLPLASVARRVGFNEVHAFIRNFRLRVGTTPGAYRRQLAAMGEGTGSAGA